MYGRTGLDRFKKAQTLEPFSVTSNSASKADVTFSSKTAPCLQMSHPESTIFNQQLHCQQQHSVSQGSVIEDTSPSAALSQHATQIGGGQSTWQPPDWAIEPLPGVYYLEVLKDNEILDRINLNRRKHIFGRQLPTCDFVLDHQSVSRQHAAVVPHKNGSIYVIDLGSVHGTFVASERLTKDTPVELEVGQSLRFAASTRTYILRKNISALFPTPRPADINLPAPPDPSDEEAVLAYNTLLNRYSITKSDAEPKSGRKELDRAAKRCRRSRVAFRDQIGAELVDYVGVSDGAGVETEPGPMGVKEGSLVGKYESLVQITVIPKGKEQEQSCCGEEDTFQKGVTDKLQEVLSKVKTAHRRHEADGLYGNSFSGKIGSSWAYSVSNQNDAHTSENLSSSSHVDDEDDLFGD